MNFGRTTLIFALVACLAINAMAVKRKPMKKKIKKPNLSNILGSCSCQNPLADILNCGCRGSILEPALGPISPVEVVIPGCRGPIFEPAIEVTTSRCASPVIDIPNYRYADPCEINPLTSLFPTFEIPNFGLLSSPMTVPSVEYYAAVDLPCGCPGPKCGCRTPAVKLPACPNVIDVPNCVSTYNYGAVIEVPSYASSAIQIPRGPCGCPLSSCKCAGSCPSPVSACGCQGPCGCAEYQILPCGCRDACSCPAISSCGCSSPCGCGSALSCGCKGSCGCSGVSMPYEYLPAVEIANCGCGSSPCSCSGVSIGYLPAVEVGCGCRSSPCGCSGVPVPVGYLPGLEIGSCGCNSSPCCCSSVMPVGLLPSVDVPPCGCGCGIPGCNCGSYLRQVPLQPPFL